MQIDKVRTELETILGCSIDTLPPEKENGYREVVDSGRINAVPLVSVHMMTYNHEKYIRDAVESVMQQECPFPYELVIGEDKSTDGTREICLELQKKYPDRIRLILGEKNAGIGVNTRRIFRECRGEFIAYLEGDDYWIDSHKLAKQVEVLRTNRNVSLLFSGAKIFCLAEDRWDRFDSNGFFGDSPNIIPGRRFMLWTLFGAHPQQPHGSEFFIMTSGFLFRRADIYRAMETYACFGWSLSLYDSMIVLALSSLGDVYYLPDQVSVYRQLRSGLTIGQADGCGRSTWLIRAYFSKVVFGLGLEQFPDVPFEQLVHAVLACVRRGNKASLVRKWTWRGLFSKEARHLLWRRSRLLLNLFNLLGFDGPSVRRVHFYFAQYITGFWTSNIVRELYLREDACRCEAGRYRKSVTNACVRRFKRVLSKFSIGK